MPKTTIHLILNGHVLPTKQQLAALIKAIDAAGADRLIVRRRWTWMAFRDDVEAQTHSLPPVHITSCGRMNEPLDGLPARGEQLADG
ncbi:hypothetical protein ACFY2K_35510 [Kitasatospora sp. NPDC001309]|uniref:hypothetical protein n=1 Tax=Kitasatospora sp. NPDC001309 TaxID=3364013 RepID=UPI003698FD09